MKKLSLIFIAAILIVGLGAFYAGMKYGQNKNVNSFSRGDLQNFRSFSSEERLQRIQQSGGTRAGAGNGQRTENGFVAGEIIAKDDKTLTVKLSDGGSKIIFYSNATEISKLAKGTAADLEVGKNITATGPANSDGSIISQSIQLRH